MIYLCMEGYTCNGDSMPDQYCGRYDVETIAEAVKMWADKKPERWPYMSPDRLAFWGCSFYKGVKGKLPKERFF